MEKSIVKICFLEITHLSFTTENDSIIKFLKVLPNKYLISLKYLNVSPHYLSNDVIEQLNLNEYSFYETRDCLEDNEEDKIVKIKTKKLVLQEKYLL